MTEGELKLALFGVGLIMVGVCVYFRYSEVRKVRNLQRGKYS
jgi:hypothetical protein